MTNLIPVKNKQALERSIIFHSVRSDQIRSGAHEPQRWGGLGAVCLRRVISSVQTGRTLNRVEFQQEADKHQHTGGVSVLPALTAQTHSKLHTHKRQAAAVHNAHPEAVAVNANLSESKNKNKQLVKYTINFLCYSPESK